MLTRLGFGLSPVVTQEPPFTFSFEGNILPAEVVYSRPDTVATYRNAAGRLVRAAANEARLDYTLQGQALGLLIEGSRTNKITIYNASPVSTSGLSASGTASVSLVTDSAALTACGLDIIGNGQVFQVSGGISGGTVLVAGSTTNTNAHSFSVWARVSAGTAGELGYQGMTPGQGTPLSGDGYQRYRLENRTPSSGTAQLSIRVEAGATLLFLLPQLEEATFCSSEIITSGASATRQTDNVLISGLSGKCWWNEEEGVMNIRYRLSALSAVSDHYLLSANNGSTSETLGLRINRSDAALNAYVRSGGTPLNSLATFTKNYTNTQQSSSLSWKGGESTIYHGGSARTATYTGTPAAISELRIGQRNAGLDALFGWVSSVTVSRKYRPLPMLSQMTYIADDKIIVGAGQSLMVGLFESNQSGSAGGRDAALKEWGATLGRSATVFINGAKGGTSASRTSNPTDYWWDVATGKRGPALDNFYAKLAAAGLSKVHAILWAQGEEDSHAIAVTTSRETYKSALLSILNDMRAHLEQPIVLIQKIGRRADNYTNRINRGVQVIREIQWEVIAENSSWCFPAAEIFDSALFDSVHLNDAGFAATGLRDARHLERIWGSSLLSVAGPSMVSASRSGTSVTVQLSHDGASDFTPASGISGFRFFDANGEIAIMSALRTSGSTVTLTLASLPAAGAQTLYYGYDDMEGIVIGNILRDSSMLALPLRAGKVVLT